MLADQVSTTIGKRFRIPPPPTIAAKLVGNTQFAFSRFQNLEPKPGCSAPPEREEAFVFVLPLTSARFSWVSIAGAGRSVVQAPGQVYLFDSTSRDEVSLDATFTNVRFHMSQVDIDQVAYENGMRRVGGLRSNEFGQEDRLLYHLALALLPAIERPSDVTTAFVQYIGLAFHEHIVRTYGDAGGGNRGSGGLSPWQIRRAHEYIEGNLADDPSIVAMAAECGISPSYFSRGFRASTGFTPHQWIIRRRVSRAKSLIRNPALTLSEISLICGFVDQSHFGRHFAKLTGSTPARWRRDAHVSD